MLTTILNGLAYGGLLYLISVGLSLIFGLRGVPNFAHGALFMLGAYLTYQLSGEFGFLVAAVGATAALCAIGAAIDILIFRRLQESHMAALLVTFGLHLVLTDAVMAIWGRDLLTLSGSTIFDWSVQLAGHPFPAYRLFVIGLAFVVAAALAIWLNFTKSGLFVRASSIDPQTTGIQGVNTDSYGVLVAAIGCGLAGLAGAASAPFLTISPTMGSSFLITCFIVVVTGGLGNPTGTFAAALVIGQVHNFGTIYVPDLAPVLPLAVMIAVFMFRPGGLAEKSA